MVSDALFRQKAPGIMALLMQDFALDEESAAAILGNLGHESGGFKFLQEIKPLIPGSAGGWGWAQWTGSRRDAFEAYVARNGFDPASDTANYKWLYLELKGIVGSEAKAIPAVKNAVGLENKVVAFELAFERAHPDHKGYPSRNEWAEKALNAYRAGGWEPLKIADAPHAPGTTEIMPRAPQIDLTQILALALPLIQQALANRQAPAPGGQPDILSILAQLLAPQPLPPPPKPPDPAPVVVKSEPKTSVGVGLIGLLGSILGMTTGVVGTPFGMGEVPTTAGTLSVVIPAAISAIGATGIFGPFGAILGRIAGAAFSAAKAPK